MAETDQNRKVQVKCYTARPLFWNAELVLGCKDCILANAVLATKGGRHLVGFGGPRLGKAGGIMPSFLRRPISLVSYGVSLNISASFGLWFR